MLEKFFKFHEKGVTLGFEVTTLAIFLTMDYALIVQSISTIGFSTALVESVITLLALVFLSMSLSKR